MKQAASAILISVLAVLLYLSPRPVDAQVELTEVVPADGAVLAAPPAVVHLCFSERLVHDNPDDFRFSVLTPEATRVGLRIVFDPLSNCVDIHLGPSDSPPLGQWTLEWEGMGETSREVVSGTINYQVAEDGSPVPSPSPAVVVTPRADDTATPAASPAATADEDDDGLDAVWLAIIVAGSALGALALLTVLFLLRRRARLGQRPPPSA